MPARARLRVIPLLRWLAAAWLLAAATLANAQEVQLRGSLAVAPAPAAMASTIEPNEAEWTWLRLRDPAALREMPAGWQLLIDQVRFEDIAVVTTAADGTVERQALGADELQRNWAPGGLLKFEIA